VLSSTDFYFILLAYFWADFDCGAWADICHFALVCCLSVLFVFSKRTDDDQVDSNVGYFSDEFSVVDAEDRQVTYEEILNELIEASVPKPPPPCKTKICKLKLFIAKCPRSLRPYGRPPVGYFCMLNCRNTNPLN